MTNLIYLASKSKSRHKLLKDSGIQFKIVEQDADEKSISWGFALADLVKKIALLKMDHVILPLGKNENEICFVLTADTLGVNSNNQICGKPKDKQEAIQMIKSYRKGAQTCTAFCLDRKIWKNNKWIVDDRIMKEVCTEYIFDVPDNFIEEYFALSRLAGIDFMQVSGAVAIEEFGSQFLKSINGSYSAVVGLPMYEVREALTKIDFF
jgi:septum formation protein